MGFLFADIPLELSSTSWRYYNELIWYYYSLIGLIPLLALTIYKLVWKKENKDRRELDDWLTLPFVSYGPVYYFIDGVVTIYDLSFFQPCRFALLYHHIIAVTIVPCFFMKKNVLWFETLVWVAHAITLYDNESMLVVGFYIATLIYLTFRLYRDQKQYPQQSKYFGLLYYCFFMFLYHDCHIPTPYL